MRRLEIPEDLREKHGFAALGDANSALKNAIFWDNGARLYGLDARETSVGSVTGDAIDRMRAEYRASGIARSNRSYGYVHAG